MLACHILKFESGLEKGQRNEICEKKRCFEETGEHSSSGRKHSNGQLVGWLHYNTEKIDI